MFITNGLIWDIQEFSIKFYNWATLGLLICLLLIVSGIIFFSFYFVLVITDMVLNLSYL